MSAHKRLLIETLLTLGSNEKVDLPEGKDVSELVRASFLLVSSNSPNACESADRVAYDAYETDVGGTPYPIRGLVLPGAKITLREFVEGLELDSTELPEAFVKASPGLTIDDYRAGLYAIRTLLHALEWSHHDTAQPARYSEEKARSALVSTLRSLDSYRRTGEP